MKTQYPLVPGHELAGICIAVGEKVTRVKIGDQCGVGCMVDSCGDCKACRAGEEQKCKKQVGTYNGKDWSGRAAGTEPGKVTKGGYSSKMVVHERFAIVIPANYPLELAGPVLCSGITMYTPLKDYGAKEGTRVGIIGLGGLGVIGIRLAKALGCKVTAISRSKAKEQLALSSGASLLVASEDAQGMKAAAGSLDLVINTIPGQHKWTMYQPLLAKGGKHVMVGIQGTFVAALLVSGIKKSSSVKASCIGGIASTQEVIELCAKHNIFPEVEVIPVQRLNEVFTELDKANDSGKRYVLDLGGSLNEEAFSSCTASPPTLKPNATGLKKLSVVKDIFKILFKY